MLLEEKNKNAYKRKIMVPCCDKVIEYSTHGRLGFDKMLSLGKCESENCEISHFPQLNLGRLKCKLRSFWRISTFGYN